jgi:long-subunit fatty acid transport protein
LFGLPSIGHEIGVFARYENFDTQFKMAEGQLAIPAFDRAAWVVGASYFLDPDVAIKFDYTHQMSESTLRRAPRSFNVGLGWWF